MGGGGKEAADVQLGGREPGAGKGKVTRRERFPAEADAMTP